MWYLNILAGVGSYDLGSGALIEAETGYKLIVGSQYTASDTLEVCGAKAFEDSICQDRLW